MPRVASLRCVPARADGSSGTSQSVVGQHAVDSRVAGSKRLVEQIDAILLDEATD